MGRARTAITLLLAALLLAGCMASFAYNRLDWLIPWWVDGYVDLTRDQRQLLKEQLAPTLEWHREDELTHYIVLLDRIEAGLTGPVDAAWVRERIDEMLEAAMRVEDSMISVALDFGATVSDEQIREFLENLREQQEEYEQEATALSDAEYAEDDYETLASVMKRFLGRLSPGQKAILRDASFRLQRFDLAWLEDRSQWLDQLESLLQREPGWQQAVRDAHARRRENRKPEYTARFDHNLGVITQATADILNDMSDRQRNHAVQEISKIREKIRKLINDRNGSMQADVQG